MSHVCDECSHSKKQQKVDPCHCQGKSTSSHSQASSCHCQEKTKPCCVREMKVDPNANADILPAAEFYSFIDAPLQLQAGTGFEFKTAGDSGGAAGITQLTPSTFKLADPGLYEVSYNVPSLSDSFAILKMNGVELADTLSWNKFDGPSLHADVLVRSTVSGSTLQLAVPTGATSALYFLQAHHLPMRIVIKKLSA